MGDSIYREKAIKKMSKPEDLTEYLKVSSPMLWILLLAILVLMVGAGIWFYFVYHLQI